MPKEALVILRKRSVKVDVLFTNIEMPGSVNGFELARRARELRPEIQVILTGTLERAADAAAGLCDSAPEALRAASGGGPQVARASESEP